MPDGFALFVLNYTGAAFDGSGQVIAHKAISFDVASPMAALTGSLRLDAGDAINRGLSGFWPIADRAGGRAANLLRQQSAALVGSPTWTARGLSLSGSNYVQVPDYSGLNLSGGQHTISIWVRGVYASQTSFGHILGKGTGSSDFGIYREASTTALRFISNDPNYIEFPGAFATVTNGALNHVVWVQSGGTAYFYLNSALAGSGALVAPNYTSSDLYIGAARSGLVPFVGNVGNLRIYKRALLPNEVARLYRDPWAGILRGRHRTVRSVASTTTYTDSLTDSLTAAESLSIAASGAGSLSDSITAAEALSALLTVAGTLSDPVTGAETLAVALTGAGSLSDATTAAEVGTAAASASLTLSDSLAAAEALTAALQAALTASESLTAAEVLTIAAEALANAVDGLTAADAMRALSALLAAPTERTVTWPLVSRAATWVEEARSITWPDPGRSVTWRQ